MCTCRQLSGWFLARMLLSGIFRYVVGLFAVFGGQELYICTGIVVDRGIILTAAHCLNDLIPDSQYRICYASANLVNQKQRKCTTIVAKKVQKRFKNEETTGPFDFALLKAKGQIRSARTAIARLDFRTSSTPESGRPGFSVGFGRTPSGWDGRLRFLRVNHEVCGGFDGARYFRCIVSDRQDGRGGLCSGDSGGPLVEGRISVPHKQRVIGILSWALQCPVQQDPAVNSEAASRDCRNESTARSF
uniref:Peptidase S1 domain-containing protein n=1 Tax=Rhodosorus marinus TaxID=101924 RepID=A0A7S0BN00_9RHOD|mmetsp:Transcript_24103/g.34704  ORF Transcript_24103/g.34704 Transcript_24103/m.34704 type:complete len:246 (+) Transcript_24103:362-1099(+)